MSYQETWSAKIGRKLLKKQRIIDVAAGREKADLVLKNAVFVNVFSAELEQGDIAVAEGLIVGIGTYHGIRELDMTGYTVNDRRVFGFVSERLLDAWLITNNISFEELSIVYMEHQNWLRKGTAFLKRKFFPKKDA